MGNILGRLANQKVGQLLGDSGGKKPGMGKWNLVQLILDRFNDRGMAVT